MIKSEPFEATVTGMHSIVIPERVAVQFYEDGHKRVLVKLQFVDFEFEFHAALNRWKDGSFSIMFSKRKQKELGIFPNDYFQLQLMEDTSKYGVEMPEELEAVFQEDREAFHIFESFTKGKQRGIIYMILAFKNPQTRIDKSIVLCGNLRRGIQDNKKLLKPN